MWHKFKNKPFIDGMPHIAENTVKEFGLVSLAYFFVRSVTSLKSTLVFQDQLRLLINFETGKAWKNPTTNRPFIFLQTAINTKNCSILFLMLMYRDVGASTVWKQWQGHLNIGRMSSCGSLSRIWDFGFSHTSLHSFLWLSPHWNVTGFSFNQMSTFLEAVSELHSFLGGYTTHTTHLHSPLPFVIWLVTANMFMWPALVFDPQHLFQVCSEHVQTQK